MKQACNNAHKLTLFLIHNHLTERSFIIPWWRFTGTSKISSAKIPVTYLLMYFCAKFREILASGSQEICLFLRKLFHSIAFFNFLLNLTGFFWSQRKIWELLGYKRLKLSIHCILQSLCMRWITTARGCTKTLLGHLNSCSACLLPSGSCSFTPSLYMLSLHVTECK